MPVITYAEVKDFLLPLQGKEVSLKELRSEFGIKQGDKSFDEIRNVMYHLAEQKIVKPSGKKDGVYKVLVKVNPIKVFGVNHKSGVFDLRFPKDTDTGMEFPFAQDVILRGGDLILIAGISNFGKTAIAMNFLKENIEGNPVLMGNEFCTADGKPTPRFVNRLNNFEGMEWVDENGDDKFTLLPVSQDWAEYVVRDKINIIDWINIETGEHYMIGSVLNSIKRAVGERIAIVVIQKSEGAEAGRGGQFTKDFADLELLIDKHGTGESRLTIGKCKEYVSPITGRSWAFGISKGVKLINIREVVKCSICYGKGFKTSGKCDACFGKGYKDKEVVDG